MSTQNVLKKWSKVCLTFGLIMFAAACNRRAASVATAVPTIATPTVISVATAVPSPTITLEPPTKIADTPQPSATPTTAAPTPEPEPVLPEAAAVAKARQELAERLGVAVAAIELTSVEPVEGADACLGVYLEDVGCARAFFAFEDQLFIFHVNQAGAAVEIVGSASPQPGGLVLTWGADGCRVAGMTQNEDQIFMGPCRSQFTAFPLSSDTPKAGEELAAFVSQFTPFTAWTPAGYLDFAGLGDTEATSADQQMMAEWLTTVVETAVAEQTNGATNQAEGWSRVMVPELELSFEIPLGWPRRGGEWVWSAPSDSEFIGLFWAEGQVEPTSLLPEAVRTISASPVDLGWVTGTRYTIEIVPDDGETTVQTHVLLPAEDRVYDFFASAPTSTELSALQPKLERMVNGIAFSDEAVGLNGPVQTAVDFFSSWLRNESGSESTTYLSQPLQAQIQAGQTLSELLGIQPGYDVFEIIWISTRNGRSQLGVTLKYAASQQPFVVTLVQENNAWLIDSITK